MAAATAIMGSELAMIFSSFDELVAGIEQQLPTVVDAWQDTFDRCHTSVVDLLLIGWSAARNRPEG